MLAELELRPDFRRHLDLASVQYPQGDRADATQHSIMQTKPESHRPPRGPLGSSDVGVWEAGPSCSRSNLSVGIYPAAKFFIVLRISTPGGKPTV